MFLFPSRFTCRSSSEPEAALHAGWGEAVPLGRGDAPREDQHLRPPGCLGNWTRKWCGLPGPAVSGHRGPAPGTWTRCCSVHSSTLAGRLASTLVSTWGRGAAPIWRCSFHLGVQPRGGARQLSHPGTPPFPPLGLHQPVPLQRGPLRSRPHPRVTRTQGPRCGLERPQDEPRACPRAPAAPQTTCRMSLQPGQGFLPGVSDRQELSAPIKPRSSFFFFLSHTFSGLRDVPLGHEGLFLCLSDLF